MIASAVHGMAYGTADIHVCLLIDRRPDFEILRKSEYV